MATAKDFRRVCFSLEGTTEVPHLERRAFKVRRINATLAPDGRTANLIVSPAERALKCEVPPNAFSPVSNSRSERGATAVKLSWSGMRLS